MPSVKPPQPGENAPAGLELHVCGKAVQANRETNLATDGYSSAPKGTLLGTVLSWLPAVYDATDSRSKKKDGLFSL